MTNFLLKSINLLGKYCYTCSRRSFTRSQEGTESFITFTNVSMSASFSATSFTVRCIVCFIHGVWDADKKRYNTCTRLLWSVHCKIGKVSSLRRYTYHCLPSSCMLQCPISGLSVLKSLSMVGPWTVAGTSFAQQKLRERLTAPIHISVKLLLGTIGIITNVE